MTVAQLKKHLDKRFTAIDRRFDAIDRRFVAVDDRSDAIDRRFSSADARAESMSEKLDAILGFVKLTHEHTSKILDDHEQRLQTLERL